MIKTYLAAMGAKGFVRPNKFIFHLNPPPVLRVEDSLSRMLAFSAFSITWPGIGANFTDYLMDGIHRKVIRDLEYDPITVSFYCNNDGDQWYFFHEWMKSYRDPATRIPAYYDEYSSSSSRLQILQGADGGTGDLSVEHMHLRFNRMFPTHVGGKEFDWSNKNDLWTFDVTFQVDWWEEVSSTGRSRTAIRGTS